MDQVAAGLSDKEIAARLCLSTHTVKGYLAAAALKLGVDNRTRAAVIWSALSDAHPAILSAVLAQHPELLVEAMLRIPDPRPVLLAALFGARNLFLKPPIE